jgi:hypothetical protein
MLGMAVRPCLGAVAAGILLLLLAEPVALRLAPVPALCLLTGSAWLIYLVIRGEPAASWQFAAAGEGRRCPDRRRDAVTQIFDPTGFKGREAPDINVMRSSSRAAMLFNARKAIA